MLTEYSEHNRSTVAQVRANEEANWQDVREERHRYTTQYNKDRHDTTKQIQADARARAAAAAAQQKRDALHIACARRSHARHGEASAITRSMSRGTGMEIRPPMAARTRHRITQTHAHITTESHPNVDTGTRPTASTAVASAQIPVHVSKRERQRYPRVAIAQMHDKERWHMSSLKSEYGWRVWYHDSDDIWRLRYIVKKSGLMEKVYATNNMQPDNNMLGVYAARRYESQETISVYVGTTIGKVDPSDDNNAGYDKMNEIISHGGGRHIMQIGTDLIDGACDRYTCVQYCNSAYRTQGYANKAEMLNTGTVRVMKSKTINENEEILFAYHECYWRRWGPEPKQRGRKRRRVPTSATQMATTPPPDPASTPCSLPCSSSEPSCASRKRRGRPPRLDPKPNQTRRKQSIKKLRWTAQGRTEFLDTVVMSDSHSTMNTQAGPSCLRRFERGEGGGVT